MKRLFFILALTVSGALSFGQVNGTKWLGDVDSVEVKKILTLKNDFPDRNLKVYYSPEIKLDNKTNVSYFFNCDCLYGIAYTVPANNDNYKSLKYYLKKEGCDFTKETDVKTGLYSIIDYEEEADKNDAYDYYNLILQGDYDTAAFSQVILTAIGQEDLYSTFKSFASKNTNHKYFQTRFNSKTMVFCFYNILKENTMTVVYVYSQEFSNF